MIYYNKYTIYYNKTFIIYYNFIDALYKFNRYNIRLKLLLCCMCNALNQYSNLDNFVTMLYRTSFDVSVMYAVNIEFVHFTVVACVNWHCEFGIRDLRNFPRDNRGKEIEIVHGCGNDPCSRDNDIPVCGWHGLSVATKIFIVSGKYPVLIRSKIRFFYCKSADFCIKSPSRAWNALSRVSR